MNRLQSGLLVSLVFVLLCIVPFLATARADDGLKTINVAGGGQIVYGPIIGASSLQGAMGTVLRDIHGHFGDRPQIGKFFQTPREGLDRHLLHADGKDPGRKAHRWHGHRVDAQWYQAGCRGALC